MLTFAQSSTVHVEASWSVLVSWCALGVTLYNTWIRRDKRTKEDAEAEAEMRSKVNLMWTVLFPSGISKALRAGMLEKNSPLRWSIAALERHKDLVVAVRKFAEENCKQADDLKLLILLSDKFEHDITNLVQSDPAYSYESVLLSAFYLCRPDSQLFNKYSFDDEEKKDANN